MNGQEPNSFKPDTGIMEYPSLETYLAMYGPYVRLSVYCKANEQEYVVDLYGRDKSIPGTNKGYLIYQARADTLAGALRDIDIYLLNMSGEAINRFLTERE